jgi:glycosyltransferase involved in cell wall biosynthesis
MKPTLSVVVPALNEEEALERTVTMLLRVARGLFDDFELILINDGSTDGTAAIADRLAAAHPDVRAVHHDGNKGLGYSYSEGIGLASKDFVCWIPGDCGGLMEEDLVRIWSAVGTADLIVVHLLSENRPWLRRVVSRTYTTILNVLFGLRMKYYNGANVYRRTLLRAVPMNTKGYGLFAEILVTLVKTGHDYAEVGMHNRERPGAHANSKAFRLKNWIRVGRFLLSLFWRIHFARPHPRPRTGRLVGAAPRAT